METKEIKVAKWGTPNKYLKNVLSRRNCSVEWWSARMGAMQEAGV
jgi:hypothetical protein